MGLNNNEPSVLSSRGSFTATDLSRRTDKTSYSVPDDGREVTISTKSRRKNHGDGVSTLTTASQTSLLIEYFDGKSSHGNHASRGPSVRVKLTPSAAKRAVIAKTNDSSELVIREVDSGRKRRPSTSSGAPPSRGLIEERKERFTLGEDRLRLTDRGRPISNDLSSLVSGDDDSHLDSRHALNVRVSRGRNSPTSLNSSAHTYNEATEISIRSGKNRSSSRAYDKGASLKPGKARSRSTSREYDDDYLKSKALVRKRSRSLSQDGTRKDKLKKNVGDDAQASDRRSNRSRSRSQSQGRSAIASDVSKDKTSSTFTNPALLEAVEDAIKRLILPQLHDLKLNQNKSKFDETVAAAFKAKTGISIGLSDDIRGIKSASMPDVTKPLDINNQQQPMVVLQPDADRGSGQGFVISGSPDKNADDQQDDTSLLEKSENSAPRLPGLGFGSNFFSRDTLLSPSEFEKGNGVPLDPSADEKDNHLAMPPMPPMPLDYPESNYAETRASILTVNSGAPYPETTADSGMPGTGQTPPPIRSRRSSISSLDSIGGRPVLKEPELRAAPSITTFADEPEHDRPNTGYSNSSGLRSPQPLNIEPKKTVVKSPSQLSIGSISDTLSAKIAKQKKKGKGPANGEEPEIDHDKSEAVNTYPRVAKNEMDWLRKQPAKAQEPDHPNHQHTTIEGGHIATDGTDKNLNNPNNIDINKISMNLEKTNPLLSANALPHSHDPMPDPHHTHHQDDEVTNPSEIQGPISLDAQPWEFGTAGTGLVINGKRHTRDVEVMEHPKDEGYMSPGFGSPTSNQLAPMGNLSNIDEPEYDPYRHSRIPSGNSHGMPSPLYDSSTGKGLDRIQSKDIVALMDHLTVRDAQRNARDTEILVTLVRSAAEMRNSFEDLKKQLEQAQHEIVSQVDQNTERSVQKVLQGPRPLPPSAPRPRRSHVEEDHGEIEAARKKSLFKRALKGLSGKSQSDLARIEQMLEKLLQEVEGLKGGQEFYQQSILGTIENFRGAPPAMPEAPASTSTANSGYYTQTHTGPSAGPSRQASGFKIYSDEKTQQSHKISPIDENTATPTQQRLGSASVESPPQVKIPAAAPTSNSSNTPTKPTDKPKNRESGSFFPKISRWSESTTTSGVKGFLRRNKDSNASDSDAFWADSPQQGGPQLQSPFQENHPQDIPRQASPLLPPSSRGTDAPVNYANIRSSLDIKHPQPKVSLVQRHQLEQQAQNFIQINSSNPSLAFSNPPLTMNLDVNGMPLSPMSDTYPTSMNDSSLIQGRPPRIDEGEEEDETPADTPLKEKKSRENRGDRKDKKEKRSRKDLKERDLDKDPETLAKEKAERRARRRERREKENAEGKSSKSKLKDEYFGAEGGTEEGRSDLDMTPSTNRSLSTGSRLKGPRPLSRSGSDYKAELENSGTVKRHKHRSSHLTSDTFGLGSTLRE